MDRESLQLGSPESLWFRVRWRNRDASRNAEAATEGCVAAGIGDDIVWGGPDGGIHWSWVDLLTHLSTEWRRLLIEELDPLGLAQPDPRKLRVAAELGWESLPVERREREDDLLCRFEHAHDLAAGLPGIDAPPFWFLRQGERAIAGRPSRLHGLDFRFALGVLEALGGAIAERLAGAVGERARWARKQWHARDVSFDREAIRLATWQTDVVIDDMLECFQPHQLFEMVDGVPSAGPILAAARMAGDALSPSAMRGVLSRLADYPLQRTPELDVLARSAEEAFKEERFEHDYELGYELAHWLRARTDIVAPSGRAEPERALKGWNVIIDDIDLPTPTIDAIAAWGGSIGPVVMVNRRGRRAGFWSGRRAVLAHEICHLLIDRRRALPAAEVLGGRVSRPAERRADAFAAELLLPRTTAGRRAAEKADVESALRSLARRFGVSFELAARQVRNSGVALGGADRSQLSRHVRDVAAL
jgi:Zn-dependent peptidase ImmA (M78 family)